MCEKFQFMIWSVIFPYQQKIESPNKKNTTAWGCGGERVPGKPEDCPDRFDTLGRESNTNENTCTNTNKMLTKYNYKIYRPDRFDKLRRGSKIVYSYSTIWDQNQIYIISPNHFIYMVKRNFSLKIIQRISKISNQFLKSYYSYQELVLRSYKVNEGFLINLKGRLNNLKSICRAFSSDGKFESLSWGILQNRIWAEWGLGRRWSLS